jgi:hypothetical protein
MSYCKNFNMVNFSGRLERLFCMWRLKGHACTVVSAWRADYSTVRLHSSLVHVMLGACAASIKSQRSSMPPSTMEVVSMAIADAAQTHKSQPITPGAGGQAIGVTALHPPAWLPSAVSGSIGAAGFLPGHPRTGDAPGLGLRRWALHKTGRLHARVSFADLPWMTRIVKERPSGMTSSQRSSG